MLPNAHNYKSASLLQKCPIELQKCPNDVTKVPYRVTKVAFFGYKSAHSSPISIGSIQENEKKLQLLKLN